MLPFEHSALLLTSDNWSRKPMFGCLFEWPLKTGFTVLTLNASTCLQSWLKLLALLFKWLQADTLARKWLYDGSFLFFIVFKNFR